MFSFFISRLLPSDFNRDRAFVLSIIKWTFVGLLIRIAVMPFATGADIFWLNYVPHQLITRGITEPYSFAKANFADWVIPMRLAYHPPLSFYLTAFFQFLLQGFTPILKEWLFNYGEWLKLGGGNLLGHITFMDPPQLFRMLFVLKLPTLFLDLSAGFMLLHLISTIKKRIFVYKLWMLNLPVLYVYLGGEVDIYIIFFIVLSLFFNAKRKFNLALLSLSLGAATKAFPTVLILPAVIFLGKNFRQRIKLFLFGIVPLILIFIPSYLSSGNYCLQSLFPGSIGTNAATLNLKIMKLLLIISYTFVLIHAHFESRRDKPRFSLENYFLLIILLFFAFQPIAMRYYIWITPFLILQFMRDKNLWKFALIQFLFLAILRIEAQRFFLGMFAPLEPTFFSSLPILHSFIAPFISLTFVLRLSYRLFIITTLAMIYRVGRYSKQGFNFGN